MATECAMPPQLAADQADAGTAAQQFYRSFSAKKRVVELAPFPGQPTGRDEFFQEVARQEAALAEEAGAAPVVVWAAVLCHGPMNIKWQAHAWSSDEPGHYYVW